MMKQIRMLNKWLSKLLKVTNICVNTLVLYRALLGKSILLATLRWAELCSQKWALKRLCSIAFISRSNLTLSVLITWSFSGNRRKCCVETRAHTTSTFSHTFSIHITAHQQILTGKHKILIIFTRKNNFYLKNLILIF